MKSDIPYPFRVSRVPGATCITSPGFERKFEAIKAPMIIPPTKNKFQTSFFQSYLKNLISPEKQAAHI